MKRQATTYPHQSPGPLGLRRVGWWMLVGLCLMLGLSGLVVRSAGAAVTHAFLPAPSAKLSEGVPASSGVQFTGPLNVMQGITGDAGHLWLTDTRFVGERHTRVDEFDAATGAFLAPRQLNEEGGVGFGEALAIGHVTGKEEVYVGGGINGKRVIATFDESNKLQGVWEGAGTQNGAFGEVSQVHVAVDDSANLETAGDVYVATLSASDPANLAFNVVYVFKPSAGGQEPAKPIGELKGTCAMQGVCSGGEVVPFTGPVGVAVSGFNGDLLVADGNSSACIAGEAVCGVDVFEPVPGVPGSYSFLFKISGTPNDGPFKQLGPMAVDALDGNVYVVEGLTNVVDEFSPTGAFIGRLAGTPTGPFGQTRPFERIEGVAADSSVTGNVFVADFDEKTQTGSVDVFGPDVVIPDVVTAAASNVTPAGAQLNGEVNPKKEGGASCLFAWGTTKQFGQVAKCEPEAVVEGSSLVPVSARLDGLAPDTTYYYRLQATNKNGANPGEEWQDGQFTTSGPGLHDESVSSVSSTSATFAARLDPHGAPTTVYFQYGTGTEYGSQIPSAPGATLGSGQGDVGIVRHVQSLRPSTTYHYRVVAVSEVAGKTEVFAGADRVFRTQPSGSALLLPDGRRWELVSPVDKHGAVLAPIGPALVQAASGGQAISYVTTLPTEEDAAGYSELVQILSNRGEDGWSSLDLSLPHSAAAGVAVGNGGEYPFFSEDLSLSLVGPFGPFTSLAPDAFPPDTERTLYLRHDTTCAVTPSTCYTPLVTGAPGYADVPEGTKFGGNPSAVSGAVKFVGASPDLAHIVVSSSVALSAPPNAGETVGEALYEWSAGGPPTKALPFVSVLPNGKLARGTTGSVPGLGYENVIARNAISDDGTRVIWTGVETSNTKHLYLRDTTGARTVELDAVQGGSGSGEIAPVFQMASSDGSRIFFTDTQHLTADASGGNGQADLYECAIVEFGGELSCELSNLSPAVGGESADVQVDVLGSSEDGTWVYFVANGALAEGAVKGDCVRSGAPTTGASCNLYELHYNGSSWEAPKLVAVLSGEDWPSWKGKLGGGLDSLTSRVSPDGRYLAFMSDRPLTGYDNNDAATGEPDEEVYLYDASGNDGSGSLVCASCDPTGARPAGVEYGKLKGGPLGLQSGGALWSDKQGIAANIPGWTEFRNGWARHQSRYLSDEGRLFFNSSDALAPQDINGNEDVYEYEPVGVGAANGCTPSSSTYEETANGCVDLISSGTAAGESGFLDASSSGDDVFFLTGERLTSQDIDGALDVYDAHVCTSGAPCESLPAPPPPCTTTDACRAAPSPQPSIFGSPATATFTGAGNTNAGASSSRAVKAKSVTRSKKLASALKACRKSRRGHKQVLCERRARKRYAVKQAARGKSTGKAKG